MLPPLTLLSDVFLHHPVRPYCWACLRVKYRNPTPGVVQSVSRTLQACQSSTSRPTLDCAAVSDKVDL